MKRKLTSMIATLLCLAAIFACAACSSETTYEQYEQPGNTANRLKIAYESVYTLYSDATACYELGADDSYIEVDTNPFNIDDYYNPVYLSVLEAFNEKLGIPDYVYQLMITTTAMQGRQTETVNGLTISWTYHPNNGLEVIYRLAS